MNSGKYWRIILQNAAKSLSYNFLFLRWLYSPEGIRSNRAQTSGGMAGPEGLCWEYGEDGPVLTDFGKKALMGEDAEVPGEWGSGT
ncbi:hypothetical protein FYJ45_29345 [Eisenbergiella tayi]|uniref:Uncharacterized protein n=1 Tax=Eisenbergiella porci TaxID=2652274 RepID=A0A6N7WA48_9FIRM|nr:hypothetical protein [Eisenbergiella porci]